MKIHEHGFVRLVDWMPRTTADAAIVQAARVSYGSGEKTPEQDKKLIFYLMKHRHTTPFEMVEFKFHVKLPIFIARQWIRHRTASVNEISGRYSVLKDEIFEIDHVRMQDEKNKQGSIESSTSIPQHKAVEEYNQMAKKMHNKYQQLLCLGMAKEQARIHLPLSTYTEWYWKIDLHNLFHFLKLRMDSHAQKEFQDYAKAMFKLIKSIVPVACEAFEEYQL